MSTKNILLCGLALWQAHSALAVPVAGDSPAPPLSPHRRSITAFAPAPKLVPVVTKYGKVTKEELDELIAESVPRSDQVDDGGNDNNNTTTTNEETQKSSATTTTDGIIRPVTKITDLDRGNATKLAPSQVVDGPLVTFIEGDIQPGSGNPACEDFVLNGPIHSFHPLMGSGNVRGLTATSYAGNSTFVGNADFVVDPGVLELANNERITRFSIGRLADYGGVRSFTLATDAGQVYEALSGNVVADPTLIAYEDLDVGSGIVARFRGAYCGGILASFGVDFLDELDSIAITDIDYSGFTDNIMPAGRGTQVNVGSQVVDNRNSSEKQTITLSTTDTVTRQTTLVTQVRALVGGSVAVEASASIPFVSEGRTRTEANWQLETMVQTQEMDNAVTTRAGTFALVCAAGKFCTARAFFMQFKMDVNVNATFTATVKSGDTYSWMQGGKYRGADSLVMQLNVTEVDDIV